jgi:hypothetical protein
LYDENSLFLISWCAFSTLQGGLPIRYLARRHTLTSPILIVLAGLAGAGLLRLGGRVTA